MSPVVALDYYSSNGEWELLGISLRFIAQTKQKYCQETYKLMLSNDKTQLHSLNSMRLKANASFHILQRLHHLPNTRKA